MRHALTLDPAIRAAVLALVLLLLANQTQTAPASDTAATQPMPFKPEELEQIVAPIALYPDALLAQLFMASTYPLEIVQAARWAQAHPEVKGDAVAKAMEKQTWDASVKSLVAFPDVLKMMNEKIEWTQKLGDAFLAQQKDVMAAVQRLRVKAKDAGNLASTQEQVVKTEAAPQGAPAPQIIVIESSNPEVVYVPTYNPTVVYGAWPYPAYPPYYYYPPGYAAGAAFFSFSVGVAVGGALWGNCNWGHGDVDIDVNRYNNFNRNEINHNRNTNISKRANDTGKWQHDTGHRQGVGYRDSATQQRYGRGASQQGLQGREEYRGRAASADAGGSQNQSQIAQGVAPELQVSLVNIQVIPDQPVTKVTMKVAQQLGVTGQLPANLGVNGDFQDFRGSFNQADGQTIGKPLLGRAQVRASLVPDPSTPSNPSYWQRGTLGLRAVSGAIKTLQFGAQAMNVDEICFQN